MARLPKRISLAIFLRLPSRLLEKIAPDITIDQNILTFLGFVTSLIAAYYINLFPLNVLLILVVIVFDMLDGIYARKQKTTSRKGYLIDVIFDRLSEAILFLAMLNHPIGILLFFAYTLNLGFIILSLRSGQHLSLALKLGLIFAIFVEKIVNLF